jgi:hypothetical protein
LYYKTQLNLDKIYPEIDDLIVQSVLYVMSRSKHGSWTRINLESGYVYKVGVLAETLHSSELSPLSKNCRNTPKFSTVARANTVDS